MNTYIDFLIRPWLPLGGPDRDDASLWLACHSVAVNDPELQWARSTGLSPWGFKAGSISERLGAALVATGERLVAAGQLLSGARPANAAD
jgi:hypothetical protein